MDNKKNNVAQNAYYHQLAKLNPFDAIVFLRNKDHGKFEVVYRNEKVATFIELQDEHAMEATQFFTDLCWQRLLTVLEQEPGSIHTIEFEKGQATQNLQVNIQQLEEDLVAIIFRESTPYMDKNDG